MPLMNGSGLLCEYWGSRFRLGGHRLTLTDESGINSYKPAVLRLSQSDWGHALGSDAFDFVQKELEILGSEFATCLGEGNW